MICFCSSADSPTIIPSRRAIIRSTNSASASELRVTEATESREELATQVVQISNQVNGLTRAVRVYRSSERGSNDGTLVQTRRRGSSAPLDRRATPGDQQQHNAVRLSNTP